MRLAELVEAPEQFFARTEPPIQQGDIVLAPVARVQTDASRIDRWERFDQEQVGVGFDVGELSDLIVHAGYGPVMIVTHDCQLDREFTAEVERLRTQDARLSLDAASTIAEADPDLDRFVHVCPLLAPTAVRPQWSSIARGEAIGVFPVPALPDRGLPDTSVVDLTYRSTIDRGAIACRLVALSDEARAMFRFAVARHDVFRTPSIGFDLEEAVGRRIREIRTSVTSPLHVQLDLDDGSTLELVQQPAPIRAEGVSRSRAPEREGNLEQE